MQRAWAMPAAAEPGRQHIPPWCLLQEVLQLMGIFSSGTNGSGSEPSERKGRFSARASVEKSPSSLQHCVSVSMISARTAKAQWHL